MSTKIDTIDRLHDVEALVEAAFMACADLNLGDKRQDALRVLLDLVGERLQSIIKDMQEGQP
jgi:hypothetical protein